MSTKNIAALSRKYGSDKLSVLAGGGNSSFKDTQYLYVKPSGVQLSSIEDSDFVKMERKLVDECIQKAALTTENEREAVVKRYIDFSVIESKNARRPSVEAPLHQLFPQTYVLHLHPRTVNAMTCGQNGKNICRQLFPDALWMDVCDPGAALAVKAQKAFADYRQKNGKAPNLVFIQNHGVFAAADSCEEIDRAYQNIFATLNDYTASQNVAFNEESCKFDTQFVRENAPILRGLLAENTSCASVKAMPPYELAAAPFTPDHIVYSKSFPLITNKITREAIEAFKKANGYLPKAILVPGKALFAAGKNVRDMNTAADFILDSAAIFQLSKAFGGAKTLDDKERLFIENWEMEAYRSKVAAKTSGGALANKTALVTGGAQGFGFGIASELVKAGAHVIIADMNLDGARKAAESIGENATPMAVDISSEESLDALACEVATKFGGIDLFVANAGVLKAGSVKTFAKKDWDFVASINYTGYFLCVKHFAPMMASQNAASGLWSDIVQINSKSGLAGSNKNAAYAAGKFGTIGMTQSFALELVADKIKVNSVCPGNYYDGPLWSDPERGLFKQYLDAGKVPGAKSIEDVKNHYLKQSPIHRGCFPADVAKAIIYACSQDFETGQAIPVTGGQIMLN